MLSRHRLSATGSRYSRLAKGYKAWCSRSTVQQAQATPSAGGFVNGVYSIEDLVRDPELDQFSVVNNGVYCTYLQHARHEAFATMGIYMDEYARKGTPLALAELNLQYKGPLRSRDRYRVSVWVEKLTAARLVLGQAVELVGSNGAPASKPVTVLTAQAVVVWLDSQYRPIRVPAEVRAKLQELYDVYKQARADAGSGVDSR